MDLCLGAGYEKPCAGQHEAQAGDDAKDEKHRAPMKKPPEAAWGGAGREPTAACRFMIASEARRPSYDALNGGGSGRVGRRCVDDLVEHRDDFGRSHQPTLALEMRYEKFMLRVLEHERTCGAQSLDHFERVAHLIDRVALRRRTLEQ